MKVETWGDISAAIPEDAMRVVDRSLHSWLAENVTNTTVHTEDVYLFSEGALWAILKPLLEAGWTIAKAAPLATV